MNGGSGGAAGVGLGQEHLHIRLSRCESSVGA